MGAARVGDDGVLTSNAGIKLQSPDVLRHRHWVTTEHAKQDGSSSECSQYC